jgi:hypothetical protein
MKVKAIILDFSVPNVGHVKILRNGRKWGIPLLKIWYIVTVYVPVNEMEIFFLPHTALLCIRRIIQFPCFHSHLMSKMSNGAVSFHDLFCNII